MVPVWWSSRFQISTCFILIVNSFFSSLPSFSSHRRFAFLRRKNGEKESQRWSGCCLSFLVCCWSCMCAKWMKCCSMMIVQFIWKYRLPLSCQSLSLSLSVGLGIPTSFNVYICSHFTSAVKLLCYVVVIAWSCMVTVFPMQSAPN